MAKHMLLAMSNALPGREQDLTQWLDVHHIPEVLQAPGFVSASRFELSSEQYKPGQKPLPKGGLHHDRKQVLRLQSPPSRR